MNRQRALVMASVMGLLTAAGAWFSQNAQAEHEHGEEEAAKPCYGINKCKGIGDCGATGAQAHSCAGQNACKGQGYLELEPEDCLKIEGGRLTEAKES